MSQSNFVRAAVLSVLGLAASAQAATLTYLPFEDGAVGAKVSQNAAIPGVRGAGFTTDVSGSGNAFRGFNGDFTGVYSGTVRSAVTPGTGVANTRSLDSGVQLRAGFGGDIYSDGAPTLNAYDLSNGFTIETSFNLDAAAAGYNAILGKDGKPTSSPLAPLQLKVRGDSGLLQIEVVDSLAAGHEVVSTFQPLKSTWYDVAVTYNGTTDVLSLYTKLSSDSTYVLQGTTTSPDIALNNTNWAIGRGHFNGGNADNFNGLIDDVRISDTVLSPSQFIGVPEPTSLAALVLGAGLLVRRKR